MADFVKTRMADEVIAIARMARERGDIGLVRGDGGVGKTTALRKATLIIADLVREAHKFQGMRLARNLVEKRLVAESAAEPQEAKRASA